MRLDLGVVVYARQAETEHLEELRDEWPAVQDAAQVVAERSAELNRRLSEE